MGNIDELRQMYGRDKKGNTKYNDDSELAKLIEITSGLTSGKIIISTVLKGNLTGNN